MGQIIDGKAIAGIIRAGVKEEAEKIKRERGITPTLAVVLVGENPASKLYVSMKEKAAAEIGIGSIVKTINAEIKTEELLEIVKQLNNDKKVHGILVQLPLPKHIDEKQVISQISPHKDVDGLTQINMGKLLKGEGPEFLPCTPAGIIELILSTGVEIKGKRAVVVGRSNIVGKPVALLLLGRHATVTICHSRTVNLGDVTKEADILVAAIGKAKVITSDMVKKGAIVIDVGTNKTEKGTVGDVDFENVKEVAGFISPVPRGVGPMTIIMLLKNTIEAAKKQLR